MDNDHPVIAELKYLTGATDNEEIATITQANFATFDPVARRQLLLDWQTRVGDDDGASHEQKAQLMKSFLELRHLDSQMRAAGR